MANEKETARKGGEVAKEATDETVRATGTATRQAEEAAEGTTRRVGRAVNEATAQTEAVGTAASRAATETLRQTNERMTDATNRLGEFFSRSARVSEDLAQHTQKTLDAVVDCGTVLGDGFQSIVREWVNYAQGAMQRNIDTVNDMMRARTLQDVLSKQSERVREEMELLLNTGVKVSEMSAKTANHAYQRLHDQQARQARRSAA